MPTAFASRLRISCIALSMAVVCSSVEAQTLDPEGMTASNANDSITTAVSLGSLSTVAQHRVKGWISSSDPEDVDFYRFDIVGASTAIYLDVDFADDRQPPGALDEDVDDGLDASLWLFDDSGRLVAFNDDSDFFGPEIDNDGTDPGSDTLADRDPFIGAITLGVGTYYVAIAWFGQSASAQAQTGLSFVSLPESGILVGGATSDDSFQPRACVDPGDGCAGEYWLDVRTTFVPEPGSAAASAFGTILLVAIGRRRSAADLRAVGRRRLHPPG